MNKKNSNREIGEIKATLNYIQEVVNRLEDKIDIIQKDTQKARELALINSNEIKSMKRNQQVELSKWAVGIGATTTILATILAWMLRKVI